MEQLNEIVRFDFSSQTRAAVEWAKTLPSMYVGEYTPIPESVRLSGLFNRSIAAVEGMTRGCAVCFALLLLAGCGDKSVNPQIDRLRAPSNLIAEWRALTSPPRPPSGYIDLRWRDNSDHEWGFVIEQSTVSNTWGFIDWRVPEWGEITNCPDIEHWITPIIIPLKGDTIVFFYRIRAFTVDCNRGLYEKEFSDYSNEASVYVE